MTTKLSNSIPKEERIIIGCRAVGGENITRIAEEFKTNRVFIYTQKEKTLKTIEENFDKEKQNAPVVLMNDSLIKRIILSCAVECKGSIRDIKEHLHNVFDFDISEGKISDILNIAADKAREFNSSIDLSSIKIGAHDEIFQAGMPVLVGVDPYSTYVYLMEPSEKRDGLSWSMAIYDKCLNQKLELETSVTDGGLGMKKGIKEVFPGIDEQGDIFHAEMKLTNGLTIYERKAYGAINNEYECKAKFLKASDKKKEKAAENYEKALAETPKLINIYDTVNILIMWVREIFEIGGYTYGERVYLLNYVIDDYLL